MKHIIVVITSLLACTIVQAQEFAIRKVEIASDKVFIFYDLVDTVSSRTYTVNLYSSRDTYVSPLQKVQGDLGLEVKPGRNRKITWSAKDELGADFDGKVGLEVRGKLYIPFIRFQGFKDHVVRKRGIPFDIVWSGGRANSLINFELLKDDKLITVPQNNVAATVGKATIRIPKNIKPGYNYRFRIVDSKNKDDVVYTDAFRVKRKIPLALQILPVLVVGYVAYAITSKGSDEVPEIPDPITPEDK
jgi:hypothetical protein